MIKIAKRYADIRKQNFIFCQLSNDHLVYHFDEAIKIWEDFIVFRCIFIGINKNIINSDNIAIHGHGLDYFFKVLICQLNGLNYLEDQLFQRIRNISGSFSEDFIKNVPYRVKGVKLINIFKLVVSQYLMN